jgi:hypothetical protein
MDAFAGSDEESVELRKLVAELVNIPVVISIPLANGSVSMMIPTTSKCGRNLFDVESR